MSRTEAGQSPTLMTNDKGSGERVATQGVEDASAAPDSFDRAPRRLDDILRSLPEAELASLIKRMGIRIDPTKRIDAPSQVARALVGIPDVRDTSNLPPAVRELLHRIAEAGGNLLVPSVPPGLDQLMARGVVFARKGSQGIDLVLPIAFLLQLKAWEGEDPRSLRALLAQAPFETLSAIASHYLGRPANPPIALSLEAAWEVLNREERIRDELERLAPVERRLLESIESIGGEVDTQELLDLEREPLRLRNAGGVAATRRGAGFSLERRAFLIPIHPNRHVIPSEVALVVGEDRHKLRETRRAQIRTFVLGEDHAPRRARFALDPAYLAVGMAFLAREQGGEVRPGVGTPKSLLVRFAQRFGRDAESIALVASLSRAVGLWDASAASPATPPGALPLSELTPLLFATWRRGGAWDEARPEREALRVAEASRDVSPIGALREMVIDALTDLGEGRWVPWAALQGYLAADARIAGIERLLRRWAERAGVELESSSDASVDGVPMSSNKASAALEVTRRIALETLPALGILDIGGVGPQGSTPRPDDGSPGVTLRLTPRGRALLGGVRLTVDPTPSKFIDTQALRVGPSSKIAHVLALASFVELGRVGDQLDLLLTPASLAKALSAGFDSEALRARIETIAPLPDTLSRMLVQASAVVGRAAFVSAAGFLWVDDPEVRELLRTRRPASELFLDPSPPGGLLLAPEVDLDRMVRRCRSLGVEIEIDGVVMRARSNTTPPPGSVAARADGAPRGTGSSATMRAQRSKTPPPTKR